MAQRCQRPWDCLGLQIAPPGQYPREWGWHVFLELNDLILESVQALFHGAQLRLALFSLHLPILELLLVMLLLLKGLLLLGG
ncbi:hypothetical protein CRG98_012837 [Punica granatum]|uniref:Uncharacterized protein n=1 Tax=Punica granatum TaxID=22663 RepID=A0A2I0KE89_PUNGR|nr:hypothetical protein CRG98_012837 [Punica granatum]